MNEMQYLIQCDNPMSWSIIYERSILVELCFEKLSKGTEVTFLWPEDSPKAKSFKGRIIELSRDESILIKTTDTLKKDYERGRKKCSTKNAVKKSDTKSNEQNVKSKKRTQRDQLACNEILEELNSNSRSSTSSCTATQSSDLWLIEKMKSLRLDLDSCHAGLLTEVDKIKSMSSTVEKIQNFFMPFYCEEDRLLEKISADSFKPTKNDQLNDTAGKGEEDDIAKDIAKESSRRSFNMPLEVAEDSSEGDSVHEESPTLLKEDTSVQRRSFNMPFDNTVTLSDDDDMDKKSYIQDKLQKKEGKKRSIYVLESSDDDDDPQTPADLIEIEAERKLEKIEPKRNLLKKMRKAHVEDDHDASAEQRVKVEKVEKKDQEFDEEGLWTLLYTEACEEKGIIELLKGTGTFIKSYVLKNIQETQFKQTCFARALMNAIFKKNALSLCSLKGRSIKKKEGGTSSEDIRPGLYEEGVNAILTYTMSWAKQQGWKSVDLQTIKQSMRQMMVEKKDLTILKEQSGKQKN